MGAGSSPLARGTPRRRPSTRCPGGLIPARAGNTSLENPLSFALQAHPRSRGEHKSTDTGFTRTFGSSPLARGTRAPSRAHSALHGLIPARAGNTYRPSVQSATMWAHPRSRGEHSLSTMAKPTPPGSSPLARGTRRGEPRRPQRKGLIPARAGNTSFSVVMVCRIRAHPRSRGEHPNGDLKEVAEAGSSPLARGTPR